MHETICDGEVLLVEISCLEGGTFRTEFDILKTP